MLIEKISWITLYVKGLLIFFSFIVIDNQNRRKSKGKSTLKTKDKSSSDKINE